MTSLLRRAKSRLISAKWLFQGSARYWERRYKGGGNSGEGSYGELADFKKDVLNGFVESNAVQSVIEFGCGDGNQLVGASYPNYLGFDVSKTAVSECRARFSGDSRKLFKLAGEYSGEQADLVLSLDVIYHLVEDAIFSDYMCRLFAASRQYAIVYSSNTDTLKSDSPHVRHREFTAWVNANVPQWELVDAVPNRFPIGFRSRETSFAHFFVFKKMNGSG